MHLIDFSIQAELYDNVYASVPEFGDMVTRIVQVPCIRCSGYNAESAPLRQITLKTATQYKLACGHWAE